MEEKEKSTKSIVDIKGSNALGTTCSFPPSPIWKYELSWVFPLFTIPFLYLTLSLCIWHVPLRQYLSFFPSFFLSFEFEFMHPTFVVCLPPLSHTFSFGFEARPTDRREKNISAIWWFSVLANNHILLTSLDDPKTNN
jgi:hypothetical protein